MKQVRTGLQHPIIERKRGATHRNYNQSAKRRNTRRVLEKIAQNLEQIVIVEIMLHGVVHHAAGIGRESVLANDNCRVINPVG